jgi:alkanesulfonate monooxygenase SsuD/methylene tetrahydromethanopterin reductase-like flavin-dependent oxidoreductase (luciferase family)
MLEPYGVGHSPDDEVTLGALVTPVTFHRRRLLAKVIATLDVVSGGRARCGLGLGWYEREHGLGWAFPPRRRYDLLGGHPGGCRTLGTGGQALRGPNHPPPGDDRLPARSKSGADPVGAGRATNAASWRSTPTP